MIDFNNFKIKRGPAKDLHDPRLIIEEGYWYLSTDTAELFVGIVVDGIPQLKQINSELSGDVTVDLTGYATEDFVREAIGNIDIPEVELYDDTELRNLVNSKADKEHTHEEYSLIDHKHDEYLTAHQDISHLATKEELPNLDGYAKLENIPDVSKFITEIPSEYITESELENKGYLTEHQSLAGYATESYVLAEIAKAALEGNDIDLSAYATKEFVAGEINKIEIPEAYNDAELRNLINGKADSVHSHEEYALVDHKHAEYLTEHQDLSHLALKEHEHSEYITEHQSLEHLALKEHKHDEYLTEHQSLEDYAKTTDLFSKDYNDLTNKPELFSGSYNDLSDKPELFNGDYNSLTNKPEIPSIEGLATEQYVTEAIAAIQEPVEQVQTRLNTEVLPKVNKVDEIVPVVETLKTTAATQEWVQEQKYTTEEYVDNAIANIEHPANPTKVSELENDAKYTNETKVLELIENNASSKIGIDFVTDIAVGHLTAGTPISKDMTIGQLLYKMLFAGEQPEEPEVPEGIVENIIANEKTMYHLDEDGNIVEVPYNLLTFDTESIKNAPEEPGFYQVYDGDEIVESGYQHLTDGNSMYYSIAIPSELVINENVKIQTWSEARKQWMDAELGEFIGDQEEIESRFAEEDLAMPELPEGYNLWVDFSQTNPGEKLRYIIIEE